MKLPGECCKIDNQRMNSENHFRPAAFIDRDGTLIEEVNFLSRVEDLRLFDFTRRAIDLLRQNGFLIVVITNQSGIGRNIYTVDDMHAIHHEMQSRLDGAIDGFYFCPHLPEEGCHCRKPNLGMLEQAQADFAIDMSRSWMIGDKDLDVLTAKNAGIGSAMVMTGYGPDHIKNLSERPTIIAENLMDAVEQIVSLEQAASVP